MRNKVKLLAATAALSMSSMLSAQAADPVPAIDAIFANWSGADKPGCAVSVARAGLPTIERAYGSADLEHGIANTAATIFEAGSVSKQFTAAAVLLLVQDGKIKLSDDIRTYFPELPVYGRPITIEHLLHHTSGLRDWGAIAMLQGWPRGTRTYTQNDALDIIRRQQQLNFLPGEEWSYSNSGYNLMAMLVGRVAGQSMPEFSRVRIYEPLGMKNTSWRDDFRRILKGRAVAYGRTPQGYQQEMPFESAYGNGGLLTTVGDMQIWNAALESGKLGPLVTAEMHRRGTLANGRQHHYAGGLMIQPYNGVPEIQHSGATAGYRAWLSHYPEQKLTVAMLCNASDVNPVVVPHRVADIFLPPVKTDGGARASFAAAAERAGLWVNQRTGEVLRFDQDGASLRVQNGPPMMPLDSNSLRVGPDIVAFSGNDSFEIRSPTGDVVPYKRAAEVTPTPAELQRIAGRYASDEVGVDYLVSVDKGALTLSIDRKPDSTLALRPAYKNAWEYPGGGLVRFVPGRKAKGDALLISLARMRDVRFTRVDDAAR